MRRGTLLLIIALFLLLGVAAYFQIRAGMSPRRYPGPGITSPNPPTAPGS